MENPQPEPFAGVLKSLAGFWVSSGVLCFDKDSLPSTCYRAALLRAVASCAVDAPFASGAFLSSRLAKLSEMRLPSLTLGPLPEPFEHHSAFANMTSKKKKATASTL